MPDTLQQSLFWTSNPATQIQDLAGFGNPGFIVQFITAAGSHDGLDTTFMQFEAIDDGASASDTQALAYRAVTVAAVSGPISFLRMKARVSATEQDGPLAETLYLVVGGVAYQSAGIAIPASKTNVSLDFPLNPATGLAWTNAAINAVTMGGALRNQSLDVNFASGVETYLYEWWLELWGPGLVSVPQDPLQITQAVTKDLALGQSAGPLGLTMACDIAVRG